MERTMPCLVFDCYPKVGSDFFVEFASGGAVCWIRPDVCRDGNSLEAEVRTRLSDEGWSIAQLWCYTDVSLESYEAEDTASRGFYEQALIDGFVCHFHVLPREVISKVGTELADHARSLILAAHKVSRDGGVSLRSKENQQWANGVTENGNDFLPLWPTVAEATSWLEDWPGYEPQILSAFDLSSHFLDRVRLANMSIGLGIEDSVISMCHPLWTRALILRQGQSDPEPPKFGTGKST